MENKTPQPGTDEVSSSSPREKFVCFTLANGWYSVAISCVQEVIDLKPITQVPHTPAYILGVINLRGNIIPVINLKRLFALDGAETTPNDAMIIVVESEDENMVIGLLVDAAYDVVTIPVYYIQPVLYTIKGIQAEFIKGEYEQKENNTLFVILDIEKILKKTAL